MKHTGKPLDKRYIVSCIVPTDYCLYHCHEFFVPLINPLIANDPVSIIHIRSRNIMQSEIGYTINPLKKNRFPYHHLSACLKIGDSISDMKAAYRKVGDNISDIKATYRKVGDSISDMKAAYRKVGDSLSDMKATYRKVGDNISDMKAIYRKVGDNISDMKAAYRKVGDSLSDMKLAYRKVGDVISSMKDGCLKVGECQSDRITHIIKAAYPVLNHN